MFLCKRDLSQECDGKYKDCTDCILDKIRAEIEQTAKDYDKFDDYRRKRGLWIALKIIDKYKAESEESD